MGDLRRSLGRRLQELRENARLTQQQVADRVGIDYKYLADIEHARKSVSLEVLERLMGTLGTEPCDVFNFRLKSKRPVSGSEEQALAYAVTHSRPATRRLALSVMKEILRWGRAK